MVQDDRQTTDDLRGLVVDFQEKFDSASLQGMSSSNLFPCDLSPQAVDGQVYGLRSSQTSPSSREREIVKKGIERLEKQILQLINVFIS